MRRSVVGFLCILAAAAGFDRASAGELGPFKSGRYVIPASAEAPRVDGVVGPEEYRNAVRITGFIIHTQGELAPQHDGAAYVTYHQGRLYIAEVWPLLGQTLKVSGYTKRDDPVYMDDSVELFVQHPANSEMEHQIIGNSTGLIFDNKAGDTSWNGDVGYASRVGDDVWTLEWSLPLSEMWEQPVAGNESFRLSICRNVFHPRHICLAVSLSLSSYAGSHTKPEVELSVDAPAIQVTGLGRPGRGELNAGLSIFSSADPKEPMVATLKLIDDLNENQEMGQAVKTIALERGRAVACELPLALSGQGHAYAYLEVKGADSGKVYYFQSYPFSYNSDPVVVAYDYLPTSRRMSGTIDPDGLSAEDKLKRLRASVILKSKVRFKAEVTHEIASLPGTRVSGFAFTVPEDAVPDYYNVEAHAYDVETGKEVGSGRRSFALRRPPMWLNNTLGVDDRAPPGFDPVQASSREARVYGRTITFGRAVLPGQIVNQGSPMLAGPIRLVIGSRGREETVQGRMELIRRTDFAADYTFKARGAGLKLQGAMRLECDGMMRVDVRIPAASIDGLRLEVPLRRSCATLFRARRDPREWLNNRGALDEPLVLPFTHEVWLGNEDVGFHWFCEGARDWWVRQEDRCIVTDIDNDKVTLRVNIVDTPHVYARPWTLTFGMQPGPVRRMMPDWRIRHFSSVTQMPNRPEWARNAHNITYVEHIGQYGGGASGKEYYGLPEPVIDPHEHDRSVGRYADVQQSYVSPYSMPVGCVVPGNPVSDYYMSEWWNGYERNDVGGSEPPRGPARVPCFFAKSLQDYLVWVWYSQANSTLINGIFFDGNCVAACENPLHEDHHYVTATGSRGEMTPIFGGRDAMTRLYKAIHDGRNPYFSIFHHGETPPVSAFIDCALEGEQFRFRTGDKDYFEIVPLDYYSATFIQSQTGHRYYILPALPETMAQSRRHNNSLVALMLLYDLDMWPIYQFRTEYYAQAWRGLERFDTVGSRFTGYWKSGELVDPRADTIKVSVYAQPGRVMLVLVNTGEKDHEAEVRLDLMKLGLSGANHAMDAVTAEEVPFSDGVVKAVIPRHEYRLVIVGSGNLDRSSTYAK